MTTEPLHYLISVNVPPHWHLHGYLMCTDKGAVELAARKMLYEAEAFGPLQFPIILVTKLTSGRELVRAIACSCSADIARLMATANDFHFSAWAMPVGDPDDSKLMKLH